jgi:ribose transport system permease protein
MAEVVERPKPLTAREAARRVLAHENSVIGIALAGLIAVLGGISRGATITPGNMANVLIQSSVRGVTAVGQAFCILTANFDLSVAGIGAMTMMLGSSMMTTEWTNILGYPASPFMVIPIMLVVGACWGLLNGTLVSRLNMPSLIVTFGVWQIGYAVAYYITEGKAVTSLPESFAVYGSLPAGPIIFFSVAAVAYFVLTYTGFGRRVYAAGGNPVSAYLSGVNVKKMYVAVFAISGFCAALASVVMTSRAMAGSIEALQGLELDSIASVVIGGVSLFGGRGNMIGVVLGSLLIGVVNNAMSVMHMGHAGRYIVKGAIIMGAVAADILRRRGR